LNRRRFLKYAGATAAVAGTSALGIDYYLSRSPASNLTQSYTSTAKTAENTSTLDLTPPVIKDFQWQPTRVVNGKVYDATISFSVEDEQSAVADVSAELEDYVPTIPSRAYSAESPRTLGLTPSQTPGKVVTYCAQVGNLKGGKEYRATIEATDSAGNEATAQLETPYVREFENIAGKDKILVGAHYMPFLAEGTWAADWNTSNGTPLLGTYDSGWELAVSKHIDWATGHGIDFFTLDWYGTESITSPYFNWSSVNVRAFTENPLVDDIQFMIMFDSSALLSFPLDIDSSANRKVLQDCFTYIVDNYFEHSSYLKIEGRHAVYFWASIAWNGNIKGILDTFRGIAKSRGYDVFFIGDPVQFYDPSPNRIAPYDAVTQWANYSFTNPGFDRFVESVTDSYYQQWSSMSKGLGVHFVPSVLPGFHRIANPEWPVLPRSAERLRNQIQVAMKHIDPSLPLALVTTFNDWTENTQVEPSVEDGFSYLQVIRDELAGS